MMQKSLLATLAFSVVLTACGGDDKKGNGVTGPDGDCLRGSIAAGSSVAGSVATTDCRFSDLSSSVGRYDAYSVSLTQGRVYQVKLNATGGNGADLFVEIATSAGVLIAESDDNPISLNSEVFFIAPQTGSFIIRAGGLDVDDVGGYRVSFRDCQATTITSTAAISGALSTSDCRTTYSVDDSSYVDVFVLPYNGTARTLTLSASAFSPAAVLAGRDYFSFESPDLLKFSTLDSPALLSIAPGEPTGNYIVLVSAAQPFGRTGAYTLQTSAAGAALSGRTSGDGIAGAAWPRRATRSKR